MVEGPLPAVENIHLYFGDKYTYPLLDVHKGTGTGNDVNDPDHVTHFWRSNRTQEADASAPDYHYLQGDGEANAVNGFRAYDSLLFNFGFQTISRDWTIQVCMYVCMCVCMYVSLYVCVYCMYVCVYVCMHVCMCVCISLVSSSYATAYGIHAYIHTYSHTCKQYMLCLR
jgi:hypothetical protein